LRLNRFAPCSIGDGHCKIAMFTESAELYDAIYGFKDYAAEAAQIAALVQATLPQARCILDVACGTGEHARHLAESHGFEVDGLDLDPGLLRMAREKHPSGSFFLGDMSDFALEKRYDVVLCLFSSIGYLLTLERTYRALVCFRQHLRQDGVLLIEPWFAPGGLEDGRIMRQTGIHLGRAVERVSRCEIDGRISRLRFEYRIHTAEGIRHATEVHELGLFTTEEMAAALEAAGLRADFDTVGLTGRGLWVARSAA
jgi:SAM-dependent methyltransferase